MVDVGQLSCQIGSLCVVSPGFQSMRANGICVDRLKPRVPGNTQRNAIECSGVQRQEAEGKV